MAKIILTDVEVTINSVNLSSSIASVTLNSNADYVQTTGFGSTAKSGLAGLIENSVTLEFHQDYASSSVEATIFPLIGTNTTVVVSPTSTVSATSPSYTFSCSVVEWQPLNGAVGELATASVTWPISGAITKATV